MWTHPFFSREHRAFANGVAVIVARRITNVRSVTIAGCIAVSVIIPGSERQSDRYDPDCNSVGIGYAVTSNRAATFSHTRRQPPCDSKLDSD
jgi:hypothetical protein